MKSMVRASICILFCAGIAVSTASGPAMADDVPPPDAPALDQAQKQPAQDLPAAMPDASPQQGQIPKLIRQLGDKDFFVRQHAQNELARLGFEAFDDLSAATVCDDLEIASRAKYLLRLMRVEWTAKNDPDDVKKLLKDYELQSEESRLERMKALAALPDDKGVPALCRLIRFEKSDVLSKMAVIKLLQSPAGAEPPKDRRAESIRKLFEKSNRPSASWILVWLRLADGDQAIDQWDKIIETESALLQRSPGETNREILGGLNRYQIIWLNKHGRSEQTAPPVRRLVDLETGELESLTELLQWSLEQKAWKLIDDLAVRFAPRFNAEPGLLYTLAHAQQLQGDDAKAEATAQKAFHVNTGREEAQMVRRFILAQQLARQGLFPWAKREYECVIAQGRANVVIAIDAQLFLAEMFHDQGEDMAAANVLESMLKKTGSATEALIASALQKLYLLRKTPTNDKLIESTISNARARMFYLQACHWERTGDQDKRRECLEKAIKLEPGDVDVLIACYRLPDQTPEYKKNISELIRKTAEDIQTEIAAQPDNSSSYNQFAWLIGNTEGNFDEALRCAQKSLELSPDNGGYYDTLARVYYAKGDYENAVRYQEKAAKLEPHSGLVAKQLELFRKARDEHKK